jgi:hypothetical protein
MSGLLFSGWDGSPGLRDREFFHNPLCHRIVVAGKPDVVLTNEYLESVHGIWASIRTAGDLPYVIQLARIPQMTG